MVIPSSQDWEHGDVSRSEKLTVREQDESTELKKHKRGHFQKVKDAAQILVGGRIGISNLQKPRWLSAL